MIILHWTHDFNFDLKRRINEFYESLVSENYWLKFAAFYYLLPFLQIYDIQKVQKNWLDWSVLVGLSFSLSFLLFSLLALILAAAPWLSHQSFFSLLPPFSIFNSCHSIALAHQLFHSCSLLLCALSRCISIWRQLMDNQIGIWTGLLLENLFWSKCWY